MDLIHPDFQPDDILPTQMIEVLPIVFKRRDFSTWATAYLLRTAQNWSSEPGRGSQAIDMWRDIDKALQNYVQNNIDESSRAAAQKNSQVDTFEHPLKPSSGSSENDFPPFLLLKQVAIRLGCLLCCPCLPKSSLWWVLDRAVNEFINKYDTQNPVSEKLNALYTFEALVVAICRPNPLIAFVSQESPENYVDYQQDIMKRSLFKTTTQVKVLARVVNWLLLWLKEWKDDVQHDNRSMYELLKEIDPAIDKDASNILRRTFSNGNTDVVKILMGYCPELSNSDAVLRHILTGFKLEDLDMATMIFNKNPYLKNQVNLEIAIINGHFELVKILYDGSIIRLATARLILRSKSLSDHYAKRQDFKDACIRLAREGGDLLHWAVHHQRKEIVAFIVEGAGDAMRKSPDKDGVERYALWYNNNLTSPPKSDESEPRGAENGEGGNNVASGSGDDFQRDIRNILLKDIIRTCNPEEIDHIMMEAKDHVGLYAIHACDFDASKNDFKHMIGKLRQLFGKSSLKCESILRYVDFPSLPSTPADLKLKHSEISEFFEWLLGDQKVEEIIELKILDRLWGAADELTIARWVAAFRVRKLHWRKQDISFVDFGNSIDDIEELDLYSSGRKAVHEYWFSDDGLLKFRKDVLLESEVHTVEDDLRRRKSTFLEKFKARHGRDFADRKFAIRSSPWYAEVLRDKHEGAGGVELIQMRAFPQLHQFLKSYSQTILPQGSRKTRVAILDNGIIGPSLLKHDATHPTSVQSVFDQVKSGESFIYDVGGRKSAWYMARDAAHGTQMASLVSALDPRCEIFIAQVSNGRHEVTPDRVEQAVLWAIEQEVDIISMSFVFHSSMPAGLNRALKKATERNIVIFAASDDEGPTRAESEPAKSPWTLTVAASYPDGKLLFNPRPHEYQYCLDGQDIFAGSVLYLSTVERVTGSSASTAIAAGLASMLLCCSQLLEDLPERVDKSSPEWKKKLVVKAFDYLTGENNKHVKLNRICNLESRRLEDTYEITDDELKRWLRTTFPRTR